MTSKIISKNTHEWKQIIANSQKDEEIQTLVKIYGFTPEKLQEGAALVSEVETLNQNRNVEFAEQLGSTQQLHKLMEPFDDIYGMHRDIAKAVFEDDSAAWSMLGLGGRRKKPQKEWLMAARGFYKGLLQNERLLEKMLPLGITKELIEARLSILDTIEAAMLNRTREMGEAQHATVERDEKIEELEKWIEIYKSVAKLALSDKPQLLEKLGLLVRRN